MANGAETTAFVGDYDWSWDGDQLVIDLIADEFTYQYFVIAGTSFPQVVGTSGELLQTTNAVNHVVPYPTSVPGGIQANDIILCFGAIDQATNSFDTWGSGFTELYEGGAGNVGSESARVAVAYKRAAGGESGTFTVSTNPALNSGAGEHSAFRTICIRGAHTSSAPEVSTGAQGASTSPNPNSLTPSWGSDKTLWIAFEGTDNAITASGGPANYTNLETSTGDASGASLAIARRELQATSEDPGAFTITTEEWGALTVAVRPAAAGGGSTIPQALTANATGTPTIVLRVGKNLAVTSTGTASLLKQVNKLLTLTSTGTASLLKQVNKPLSATSTGTPSIVKKIGKLLSATSTATPSIATAVTQLVFQTLSATATGTASIATAITKRITLTVTSTATATIQTVIQAAGGALTKIMNLLGVGQ